jgi:hypothetical protein
MGIWQACIKRRNYSVFLFRNCGAILRTELVEVRYKPQVLVIVGRGKQGEKTSGGSSVAFFCDGQRKKWKPLVGSGVLCVR